MALSHDQVDALLTPLDQRRVRQVQGNAHLEAWDIRRHLLRVFGWGGWSFRVLKCECILERSTWEDGSTHNGRHTVAYRVVGALDIYDRDGSILCTFEDGATGDAQNQPSFADAHDMALKTAMSQALKRCAVNLGDRFGLSLYNGGSTNAVVGKSLAHTAPEREATDHVESGELDPTQIEGGAPDREAGDGPAAVAPPPSSVSEGGEDPNAAGPSTPSAKRLTRAAEVAKEAGLSQAADLEARAAALAEKERANAPEDQKVRAGGGE